jgi:hypothetical protein
MNKMSDLSNTDRRPKSRPGSRFEYVLFFSLIFILAIPFSTVDWMIDLYRKQTLVINGPLARAWLEAHRITPIICSA